MRCKRGLNRNCLPNQIQDSAGRTLRPTDPGTTWRIMAAADLSRAHSQVAHALLPVRGREADGTRRYPAHAARRRAESRAEAASLSGFGDRSLPVSLRAHRV